MRGITRLAVVGLALLMPVVVQVPSASAATQSVTAVVASLNGSPGVSAGFGSGLGHFTPQFVFKAAGHGCTVSLDGSFVLDDGAGNTLTAFISSSPCFDPSLPIAVPPISQFSLLLGQGTGIYSGATGTGTYSGTFQIAVAGLVQLTIQT